MYEAVFPFDNGPKLATVFVPLSTIIVCSVAPSTLIVTSAPAFIVNSVGVAILSFITTLDSIGSVSTGTGVGVGVVSTGDGVVSTGVGVVVSVGVTCFCAHPTINNIAANRIKYFIFICSPHLNNLIYLFIFKIGLYINLTELNMYHK